VIARRSVLALILALGGIEEAILQGQVQTSENEAGLSVQSSLVIVLALVRTKAGELVFTLKADDFIVTDNGSPQKIRLDEDTGGAPLALVVVLETGGAGAREFEKYSPLLKMLEPMVSGVPHRIAVVAFDSEPRLVQKFSTNVDAAVRAIEDLTPNCSRQHHMENCEAPGSFHDQSDADNGAAILDGLGFAIDLLRAEPAQYRRAILLITETLDRGSKLNLEDAVRALSDTNTAIYSVGFSTGKSEAAHYAYRELPGSHRYANPPHGCMGKDPVQDPDGPTNKSEQAYDCLTQLAPPLALAKMVAMITIDGLKRNVPETVARLTGGEYFKLTDAKSLERSLETIANHLPNRYVLSFEPISPQPGFHALAVQIPKYSGLEVLARNGYWVDETTRPSSSH
jgi:VWFA-related protein